jgi:hypothetical protein
LPVHDITITCDQDEAAVLRSALRHWQTVGGCHGPEYRACVRLLAALEPVLREVLGPEPPEAGTEAETEPGEAEQPPAPGKHLDLSERGPGW